MLSVAVPTQPAILYIVVSLLYSLPIHLLVKITLISFSEIAK